MEIFLIGNQAADFSVDGGIGGKKIAFSPAFFEKDVAMVISDYGAFPLSISAGELFAILASGVAEALLLPEDLLIRIGVDRFSNLDTDSFIVSESFLNGNAPLGFSSAEFPSDDDGTSGRPPVDGTSRDDVLTGGAEADVLHGFGGNDRLFGGAGNDSLQGGAGDDTLYGGAGADLLAGGPDDDTLFGGEATTRCSAGWATTRCMAVRARTCSPAGRATTRCSARRARTSSRSPRARAPTRSRISTSRRSGCA